MAPVFLSVMQMTVQVVAKILQMAHLLEIVPKYISWTAPSWEKCLCFWPNFTWSTLQMGPFLFSPDSPCFLKCSWATAQQPFNGSMESLKSQWRTPIKANYLFCYGCSSPPPLLTMQSNLKLYRFVSGVGFLSTGLVNKRHYQGNNELWKKIIFPPCLLVFSRCSARYQF